MYTLENDGNYSIQSFIMNVEDNDDRKSIEVCSINVNNGKVKFIKG